MAVSIHMDVLVCIHIDVLVCIHMDVLVCILMDVSIFLVTHSICNKDYLEILHLLSSTNTQTLCISLHEETVEASPLKFLQEQENSLMLFLS